MEHIRTYVMEGVALAWLREATIALGANALRFMAPILGLCNSVHTLLCSSSRALLFESSTLDQRSVELKLVFLQYLGPGHAAAPAAAAVPIGNCLYDMMCGI